jgi:BirA family transcriptional regulator, biotin operon repressor / biotin---[acetyl-CoA-carboxylase] ligase
VTVDATILRALRTSGENAVSGAELAERLGISRAAIWARIEELRSLGYEIQANPHDGYKLCHSPDVLHGDDILALLPGDQVNGRDLRVFQETTSTNDVIDKLGRDGVKEGVVVFAESQSKGRGRLGRSWISLRGKGLWFSILLRPPLPPQSATQITIASATAVVRALSASTGVQCDVKWPNDILIGGKKVCGILTEMSAELESIKYVVLGIGLNVNFDLTDFPPDIRKMATSLKIELGKSKRRCEIAAALLRELDLEYRRILNGEFEEIANQWESACTTIGQDIEIVSGRRVIAGRAESLDNEGALLLRTQHGRLERIIGGDVTVKQ